MQLVQGEIVSQSGNFTGVVDVYVRDASCTTGYVDGSATSPFDHEYLESPAMSLSLRLQLTDGRSIPILLCIGEQPSDYSATPPRPGYRRAHFVGRAPTGPGAW